MSTSIVDVKLPAVVKVGFSRVSMSVELSDGRTVIIPLAWYPKLAKASRQQLKHFEISPCGYGIHWLDIDEDLSVHGFLFPNKTPTLNVVS